MTNIFRLIILTFVLLGYLHAEPLKKVTLQLSWFDQFQFAGYYMAKEKGFYKQFGLDVQILPFQFGLDIPDDVSKQKTDFAIGRETLVLDQIQKKNLITLYALFQSSPLVLLATKESKINNIEEFRGKTIMSTIADASEVSLKAMISSHQVNTRDLNFIDHTHNINDLIDKNTDVMSAYLSKAPYVLEKQNIAYTVFDPKEFGFDMYSDFLFTSDELIQRDPELVNAFREASLLGWVYAYDNIEQSIEHILEKYNKQNLSKDELRYEAKALKKLSYFNTNQLGKIKKSKFKRIIDIYNVMGLSTHKVDVRKFIFKLSEEKIVFTKEEERYLANNPKVSIAMMNNFKPFSFVQDGIHQGLSLDILEEISNKSGLVFDIQKGSWSQGLSMFKQRKVDMISGISHTQKREAFTLFTQAFYKIPTYVFGLKTDLFYTKENALENKRVGISKNIFYKDDLSDMGIRVVEYANSKGKAKALALGEIDYFLASYTSGLNAINSQFLTNIKPLKEFQQIKKEDLRFGVNKDKYLLQSIIQKSLNSISVNDYTKLAHKWVVDLDEQKGIELQNVLRLNSEEEKYLQTSPVIKMCNNPNWKPIEFLQEGKMDGIVMDTLSILEKRLNVKFEHVPTKNWTQAQQFLKEKKCDILPAAIKTSKREKYAKFTQAYLHYKLAIITRDDKPFVDNIDEIVDKSIARKKGSGLITKLKNVYPNINIVQTKDYLDSFKKVSTGQAYCTIATLPVASYNINAFALNNLHVAGYTDMTYSLSIAVRDDKPLLLEVLNKGLKSITAIQHRSINNKWANVEIKQSFNTTYFMYALGLVFIVLVFLMYRQWLLKKQNITLSAMVEEKTKELQIINSELEIKIDKAVKQNSQKDRLLYEQSNMAAMGEMIGNIAHQWRQPLSVISSSATGMQMQKEWGLSTKESEDVFLNSINESAQHLSKTIDDFRYF
ncbi:MAG: transporter substrate-binding domain-containing protein, partial [Campylobacterota bacterium]|nr:transporter substrate-binding domain-containing protein [Campylobacterota bacterium]